MKTLAISIAMLSLGCSTIRENLWPIEMAIRGAVSPWKTPRRGARNFNNNQYNHDDQKESTNESQ